MTPEQPAGAQPADSPAKVKLRTAAITTDQPTPAAPPTNWEGSLRQWAYQLTVLKVVTYVGNAEIDEQNADGIPTKIKFTPGGNALYTVCDLIGGDITNVIPPDLVSNADLRAFHAQQVAAAAAVLPNNLKALGDLLGSVLPR